MQPSAAILRRIPFFQGLDENEFRQIAEIAFPKRFRRKSIVFMEGEKREAVFFIQKGSVKVYKIDVHGQEQIVNFLKAGDMFPHVGFFDTSPYPATCEVIEDAELWVIPISSFEQVMLETPSIAIKVMKVMGQKLLDLQEKLQQMSKTDVNRRIIGYLVHLAKEHGRQAGDLIEIDLPLTHSEIAHAVGTTRETVNRLFNQLKKEQILSAERKKIFIHDMAALEASL